jgi:hypothetical protein
MQARKLRGLRWAMQDIRTERQEEKIELSCIWENSLSDLSNTSG